MTFNINQPADNSKIRNGPALIRENFQAIQDGDLSFHQDRVNLPDNGVPSTSSTMMRIYSDDDGDDLELFCKDTEGNRVQITKSGGLAGIARATISSSGSVSSAFGITTATRDDTGQYSVYVDSGWLTVDSYTPVVTVFSGSNAYFAVIRSKESVDPSTNTRIRVNTFNTSGAAVDAAFQIIVIGGR